MATVLRLTALLALLPANAALFYRPVALPRAPSPTMVDGKNKGAQHATRRSVLATLAGAGVGAAAQQRANAIEGVVTPTVTVLLPSPSGNNELLEERKAFKDRRSKDQLGMRRAGIAKPAAPPPKAVATPPPPPPKEAPVAAKSYLKAAEEKVTAEKLLEEAKAAVAQKTAVAEEAKANLGRDRKAYKTRKAEEERVAEENRAAQLKETLQPFVYAIDVAALAFVATVFYPAITNGTDASPLGTSPISTDSMPSSFSEASERASTAFDNLLQKGGARRKVGPTTAGTPPAGGAAPTPSLEESADEVKAKARDFFDKVRSSELLEKVKASELIDKVKAASSSETAGEAKKVASDLFAKVKQAGGTKPVVRVSSTATACTASTATPFHSHTLSPACSHITPGARPDEGGKRGGDLLAPPPLGEGGY